MKKVVLIASAVLLTACMVYANGQGESEKQGAAQETETRVLKASTLFAPQEITYKGYEAAIEYINSNSDGRLEIQLFANGQLGGQDTHVQDLSQGMFDIGQTAPAALSGLYPPMGILGAPYIFESPDQMLKVLNGPIGSKLIDEVDDEVGVRVLAAWYYGTRHLTSNILGTTPEELSNVKMRIYNAPIAYEFANALGTKPTPVDFSELYLALKTNTVDAQENPIPTIYAKKFYEVQEYLILTGHVVAAFLPVINSDVWDSLPADLQEIVTEGFLKGGELVYELTSEGEENLISELEAEGMTVVVPSSIEPFQKRAWAAYEDHADEWDLGLVEEIQRVE